MKCEFQVIEAKSLSSQFPKESSYFFSKDELEAFEKQNKVTVPNHDFTEMVHEGRSFIMVPKRVIDRL